MTCAAKIRPFPDDTEVGCVLDGGHDDGWHKGKIRDYAHPGSLTVLDWDDNDRRNFRGEWAPCPSPGCILPADHPRLHAT